MLYKSAVIVVAGDGVPCRPHQGMKMWEGSPSRDLGGINLNGRPSETASHFGSYFQRRGV